MAAENGAAEIRAAHGLIEFRERQRGAQLEAAGFLLLRYGDGGWEGWLRRRGRGGGDASVLHYAPQTGNFGPQFVGFCGVRGKALGFREPLRNAKALKIWPESDHPGTAGGGREGRK